MTKLLSRNDVVNVLKMEDTIDILEKAFRDLASGKAVMPQRTPISSEDHGGLALFMPAYLKGMGALGAKVVTVYKDNPKKYKIPTVLGTIILLDEKTGAPIAIMDGGYLTAMRTGGVAGLATRILARKDAKVHTMFGTGGMAKTHAWAVDKARKIEKLILFSIDPMDVREKFSDSLKEIIDCEIEIANDPADAVDQADIVTLITSAKDPIVDGDWFNPGTHINGVGSHAPSMRELDVKTILKSKVVCDLVDACKAEAGDFMIPANAGEWSWDMVHGSLGDVINGKIPGRESDDEITLFKSVGLAIQDISTAYHVYIKAIELNAGSDFNFMK
ncbi:ornithine cyclodeaminase family protein [bacterium]|nr:ornithine cyclodeaminase family protein [bacterium]MBU1024894.1 ornithine cyclodeaminase family protein [bacterium]